MKKRKSLISMVISCVLLLQVITPTLFDSFGFNQVKAANEGNLLIGDVDGNGTINSIDFAYMRMVLLGTKSDFPPEDDLWVSDVTGDGKFNSIDFAYMRMYLLGTIKEFPKKATTATPTPTIEVTPTATPTIKVTPTPTIKVTPTATPTIKVTPTATPTIKVTPTPTPTIKVTPTSTPTIKVTPTPTPTIKVTPTATPTINVTPTATPTIKITPTPTVPMQTIAPIPNDIARNKIAICSSSIGEGFEAGKAVDGILNTTWTAKGFGQWIRIDLGNEFTINKTEFITGENKAHKYKIEASMDDENYTVVVDKTSNTSASNTYTDSVKETKARFVRLTVTGIEGSSDGNVSINEFRVYRTSQASLPTILPSPSPVIVTDYIRPYVTLSLQTEKVSVNGSVQITVAATDDVGVKTKTLKVNGTALTLNDQGIATYMPKTAGVYKVELFAYDNAGNQGYASKELRCVTSSDGTAPQASITSPGYGSSANMPIEIVGTAKDANICQFILEYSEKDKNNYIRFAEGTTNVEAGVLGSFDPNVVKKGLYDIRLTVYDNGGLVSQAVTTVLAEGKMTLRNFSVAYSDISIPVVNGMPLELKRYYDSTNKAKGDFGYGWTSEIDGIKLTESCMLSVGWSQNYAAGVSFVKEDKPHYIVVSYPDGRTDKFLVKLKNIYATDPMGYYSLGTEGMATFEVIFEPVSGTYSTLTAENMEVNIYTNLMNNKFGLWQYFIDEFSEEVYNQGKYTLTTQDGKVIKFDGSGKVESLSDSYGAKIVPQSDGLQYTRGTVTKKLSYSKANGVINSASDMNLDGVAYEYDKYGDLVSFTDLENHKTKFIYDNEHRMIQVINPNNEVITRNVYDDLGRLVYVYDAASSRSEFKQETTDSKEVITVID